MKERHENCVKDYAAKYGRQIYRDGQFDDTELVGMEVVITEQYRAIEESSHHVFGAMANYVRKFSNPNAGLIKEDQYTRYICIIVTKCDAWEKCLSEQTQQHLRELPNPDIIASVSNDVEHWLEHHDPAFTSTVRDFAQHYTYVPISAAGRQIKKRTSGTGTEVGYDIGIEPLNPRWVDVPFLCALYPPIASNGEQK